MMENGIKRIRLCMGMTQQAFADMLGCSQGNIAHYEIREQTVPPEVAKKIIQEASVRGSRVTYEDIYGVIDAPVAGEKMKIEEDVTVVIEENGALAEVLIPAFELNDIRRERDEYLAQTASDLYDRVVYMVRASGLDQVANPEVKLEVYLGDLRASVSFWLDSRRERQDKLKQSINDCMGQLLNASKELQSQ